MKNGYNYDMISNTLTITNSFAKKASKVGSVEYNIVLKLRQDCPNLTIVKVAKENGSKQITFKTMGEFIALHRNAEELTKQFEGVRTLSKFHSMPYRFVKKWFDATFPYYGVEEAYTLDADGKIVVLSTKKEEGESSVREASEQSQEVLDDQDSECEPARADDTPLDDAA